MNEKRIDMLQSLMLGGERQWYTARGAKADLPVLLFLHGGPGSPQTGAQHKYNRELEDHFIVVNWDQRGAGKSYRPGIDPATMNVNQLLNDARELLLHILGQFGRKKAYVMGHSMGALMGLQLVHKYPELVTAYIGINQPVNRIEEEEKTHRFVLEESERRKHRKAISAMSGMPFPVRGSFRSSSDLVTQRTWLTKFGGVTYRKNAVFFNLSYIFSSHLTWGERTRFMKGFAFSSETLWNELNSTNLQEIVRAVKVPVYFVIGKHDKISHATAAEYIEVLDAPYKELAVFEESGHFACFEEAERFNRFMISQVKRRHEGEEAG